ncbi:hypothetical protein EBR96_05065, partial [bacterium]|nr:hypothetical protein [bacterium]
MRVRVGLVCWCGMLALFFILGASQFGGHVVDVDLSVVGPDFVPVKRYELQYQGAISGKLTGKNGRPLALKRFPEGDYEFRVDAPGFAPRQWRQRLTPRLRESVLLVELKSENAVTPYVPRHFQTIVHAPIAISKSVENTKITVLKIRALRRNISFEPGQKEMAPILRSILDGSPVNEPIVPPGWVESWQEIRTEEKGRRV